MSYFSQQFGLDCINCATTCGSIREGAVVGAVLGAAVGAVVGAVLGAVVGAVVGAVLGAVLGVSLGAVVMEANYRGWPAHPCM